MAMELSHRNWKLLFGDGARRCQLSIVAGGHASAQIPGVSGANLASFGDADSIVQAVEKSGLRRLS